MDTITTEMIRDIIYDNLKREMQGVNYHREVTEVLKKFNGKKPTKHIANDFQKLHPDYAVNWRVEYGMFHLEFWGGSTGRNYQDRYSMLIGYDTNPIVDVDKFQEFNASYGYAAEKRNQEREQLLNDSAWLNNTAEALNEFNKAHTFLKTQLADSLTIPDSYYIEKLAPCYVAYPPRR